MYELQFINKKPIFFRTVLTAYKTKILEKYETDFCQFFF